MSITRAFVFGLWLSLMPAKSWATDPLLDPFHLQVVMPPTSKYPGERINTDEIRTVTDITGTIYQGDVEVPAGYRLVANFFHSGETQKFYTALVPIDSVEREYLLTQPFQVRLPGGIPITLAHHMIRFKMSKPIWLVAETPDRLDFAAGIYNTDREHLLSKPIELHEMILSPEPAAPFGKDVSSIEDGIFNNRVMAVRLMSLTSRSKGIGDNEVGRIKTIALKPDPAFGRAALEKTLAEANRDGMSKMYDVFLRRCDTVCFDILGASRPGLSRSEQGAIMYALTPLLDLINRFQWLTRIFPPLTPLSVLTRNWSDLNPQVEELRNAEEFQRLAPHSNLSFCAVPLTRFKAKTAPADHEWPPTP